MPVGHAEFLITCEHGGNRIPAPYAPLFRGHRALLDSHRGYDSGALVMARRLARAFDAALVTSTVSRLLVDLNRSIGHPRLFSAVTRALPASARANIVERHYRPYRLRAEGLVGQAIAQGRRVIHIASHSFTPALDGKVRTADVGLLYHPARGGERFLSRHLRARRQPHPGALASALWTACRAARHASRIRSRRADHGQANGPFVACAARDFDHQSAARRPQSLTRPSATLFRCDAGRTETGA
jgi:hypothetical protein